VHAVDELLLLLLLLLLDASAATGDTSPAVSSLFV